MKQKDKDLSFQINSCSGLDESTGIACGIRPWKIPLENSESGAQSRKNAIIRRKSITNSIIAVRTWSLHKLLPELQRANARRNAISEVERMLVDKVPGRADHHLQRQIRRRQRQHERADPWQHAIGDEIVRVQHGEALDLLWVRR